MELEVSKFARNLFLGVTFVPLAKPLGIEPIHSGIVPGLKKAFFTIDECEKCANLLCRAREGRRRCSEGREEVLTAKL